MVAKLSKDHRLPDEESDKAYFEQLRAADWKTRLIKLADVYDNLYDAGSERDKRKRKAGEALTLAVESEPPMLLARRILSESIASAESSTQAGSGAENKSSLGCDQLRGERRNSFICISL